MQLKDILKNEIHSDIEAIEKDEKLYHEINFNSRIQAIDYIEFYVIDRINAFNNSLNGSDSMKLLIKHANKVKRDLEDINEKMFYKLRTKIAQGGCKGALLMDLIDEHLDYALSEVLQQHTIGYDNLDIFLNGLLTSPISPVETKHREPEMIFYQKTPARVILELINKANFKSTDVFFDLGSGLGQVNILVNLLTAVVSKGVEFEPAFCNYANSCIAGLNLKHVSFVNIDARYADYSQGTVFFMYTPFEGKMLRDVLQKLKTEATKRIIKIFTYGPCTPKVAQESWMVNRSALHNNPYDLGEFISE